MVICEISSSPRRPRYSWTSWTHVPEQRQHLVVGGVIWDEETQVGLVENRGDPDQASTTSRDDSHVLPGVLASLALAMMLVVHSGDGLAEGLDACGRGILSAGDGNVDMGGPLKAALDVVLDLCIWGPFSIMACRSVFFVSRRYHCRGNPPQEHPDPSWPISLALRDSRIHSLALCTRRHR